MKTEEKLTILFDALKTKEAQISTPIINEWIHSKPLFIIPLKTRIWIEFQTIFSVKVAFLFSFVGLSIGTLIIFSMMNEKSAKTTKSELIYTDKSKAKNESIILTKTPNPLNYSRKITNEKSDKTTDGGYFIGQAKLMPIQSKLLETNFTSNSVTTKNTMIWAGVFKNYSDYLNGKFCDSVPINMDKNKIYIGSFDRLIVKTPERKSVYKLGSVYGYFDGINLHRYRITNSNWDDFGYFTVRDTNGLILYSQYQFGYKGTQSTGFYYSKTLNSEIKALSYKNLKQDFSDTEFPKTIKPKIDKLTNLSKNKWMISLKEINEAYKKYYF
jgi:hypothetical protein